MKLHDIVPIDTAIWRVGHKHHHLVHNRLESLGLFRGQPRLLAALWEQDGQTHSELSNRINVQPATLTKMVQRMECKGFLERRPDAHDQRVSRVFLTPPGIAIREDLERVFIQLEADELQGFSDVEKETLHHLLLRVLDNLEKFAPSQCSRQHIHDEEEGE